MLYNINLVTQPVSGLYFPEYFFAFYYFNFGVYLPCSSLSTKQVVNFMCQPDWALGCPGIWLNIVS